MRTVVCLYKLALSRGRKHCTGSKCVPFISAAGLVVVCHMVCVCMRVYACAPSDEFLQIEHLLFVPRSRACRWKRANENVFVLFTAALLYFPCQRRWAFIAKPRSKVKFQLRQMQSENALISANVEECVCKSGRDSVRLVKKWKKFNSEIWTEPGSLCNCGVFSTAAQTADWKEICLAWYFLGVQK